MIFARRTPSFGAASLNADHFLAFGGTPQEVRAEGTAWRLSASRSRKRWSDTLITPPPLRLGSGWAKRSDFGRERYEFNTATVRI